MAQEARVLRHELKYIISDQEHAWLRDRLSAFMPMDSNADPVTRGYAIRSLYYDDPLDSALFEKADGNPLREKYRLRIYNLSDRRILLERKSKVINLTAKDSALLTREQCDRLLGGDFEVVRQESNPLLMAFYAKLRAYSYRPKVLVDYFREAYVLPTGNVRITFDRDLRSGHLDTNLFSGRPSTVAVLEPGTLVLEVKYDEFFPPHIRQLLQGLLCQRMAVSKYVLCRRFH